jgi:predicted aspartyl protease
LQHRSRFHLGYPGRNYHFLSTVSDLKRLAARTCAKLPNYMDRRRLAGRRSVMAMPRSVLVTFALMLVGGSALAQPLTNTLEAVPGVPQVDQSSPAEDIRFKADRHNRMTVAVEVEGSGPYRFLVDTGADRTVVSDELAARLKLSGAGTATLHSASGSSEVKLAAVPRLQISKSRVRSLDAPVLNASHIGADGILGMDSLRSARVEFDFNKKHISVAPSRDSPQRVERDTIVVRGKLRRGHLILTSARAQGTKATVILDTGAEITIGNAALRRRLGDRLGEPLRLDLVSVTGQSLAAEVFVIKQVELGGVKLENLAVAFADVQTFGKLGFSDRPALLLGMNAMRAFERVSIDFGDKKLRLFLPHGGNGRRTLLASR